jgi:uncharacterized protein
MITETPVLFFSDGIPLVGRVYRNGSTARRQAGVVVTGSWLTVKEQMPALYARRLAERGYTALAFDFAGFGESGGEPRQAEFPHRKIGDILAATDFLASQSFVEPGAVGHLAICASAQYGLAALARGSQARSFVSVAGWFHDTESVAQFYGGAEGVADRLGRSEAALATYLRTSVTETVPAYAAGDDRAGMFFELDYYGSPQRGAIPAWRNEMATMSWGPWLNFDGLRAAASVDTPTLFVHGDGCVFPDNARAVHDALGGEKRLVWHDGFQVDFYDRPDLVTVALDAADDHFRRTLPGA